ncbi:MAG: oligosaccharide 4-alpha-D-glucosyltransferase, partial [Paraglaciecola sp.]
MFFSKYTIFSAFSHQTLTSFKAHTSLKILTPAKPISLIVLVLLSSLVKAAEYQSHRVEGNKL